MLVSLRMRHWDYGAVKDMWNHTTADGVVFLVPPSASRSASSDSMWVRSHIMGIEVGLGHHTLAALVTIAGASL